MTSDPRLFQSRSPPRARARAIDFLVNVPLSLSSGDNGRQVAAPGLSSGSAALSSATTARSFSSPKSAPGARARRIVVSRHLDSRVSTKSRDPRAERFGSPGIRRRLRGETVNRNEARVKYKIGKCNPREEQYEKRHEFRGFVSPGKFFLLSSPRGRDGFISRRVSRDFTCTADASWRSGVLISEKVSGKINREEGADVIDRRART